MVATDGVPAADENGVWPAEVTESVRLLAWDALEASTEYSIIGKGLHGEIVLWNEGARRLYGYQPGEVVGKANSSILHTAEDVAAGRPAAMMEAALEAGKWEGIVRRVRKDGTHFTARVVLTPRRDHSGAAIGFLLISKDATVLELDRAHTGLLNQKLLEKVHQLAESNLERSRLLADLVKAQEAERARIASDIHDDSIQVMSAAALRVEMLGQDLKETTHGDAVDEVAERVRHAVGRLRRLIFDLSPPSLESEGLGPAIEAYLSEVAADGGFEWTVQDRHGGHLSDEVKTILYRIAQEAIRNAQKHAQASRVTVALSERDGGSLLRIADDGVGFAAGRHGEHRPGHVGLPSMRERAAVAGGSFQLGTAPGAGCVIEVWVPDSAWRGTRGRSGSSR
jgi:PAS domain S-box-containing protein